MSFPKLLEWDAGRRKGQDFEEEKREEKKDSRDLGQKIRNILSNLSDLLLTLKKSKDGRRELGRDLRGGRA